MGKSIEEDKKGISNELDALGDGFPEQGFARWNGSPPEERNRTREWLQPEEQNRRERTLYSDLTRRPHPEKGWAQEVSRSLQTDGCDMQRVRLQRCSGPWSWADKHRVCAYSVVMAKKWGLLSVGMG